jgi:Ca2+-binding RTX toxin-like protein
MRHHRSLRLLLWPTVVAALIATGGVSPTQAGLQDGGAGHDVVVGRDDDNVDNPVIHPPGTAANQSLNNADILLGGHGNDVLIGLLGSDFLDGGPGDDILVGGPEGGVAPNSDIQFGGSGRDVALWAPGDGSDAFLGGSGRDALVFGVTDRVGGVPVLSPPVRGYPGGVPTANVSGMGGFCTLERVTDPSLGYEFLVRFFVRATGLLAVTIRVTDVEQVFCASEAGGEITFADLTEDDPAFAVVSLADVARLNETVALMIR